MLNSEERKKSINQLVEFLNAPCLETFKFNMEHFEKDTVLFLERIIELSKKDQDIFKKILEIRVKLARNEKLSNIEADLILNQVQAKYFNGNLNISDFEFKEMNMENIEINGDFISTNVLVRSFNNQYCTQADILMWGETDSLIPRQTFQILDNLHE